jgi:hypothetical protein
MKPPIVIGMMRSASRLTWQILRHLEKTNIRPGGWVIPEWPMAKHDEFWPLRTHAYVSEVPVIYTFRHPLEAFLSLKSKFMLDIGSPFIRGGFDKLSAWKGAMKNTGKQWPIYRQLRADQAEGRPVLFLRYEDYYDSPEGRIKAMAEFMGVELSDDELAFILKDTSVEKNFERGAAMSHFHPEAPFSAHCGEQSGMQRDHVSAVTMGQPGEWIKTQPDIVDEMRAGTQPALQALKEMCEDMGYEI